MRRSAGPDDPVHLLLHDVLDGLSGTPKTLPCKWFYDARGSALFDRICELEAYYLTRTELQIMRDHIQEMVDMLGPAVCLVEYGSGSSLKTRILLDHLEAPAAYVPIDISGEHLLASADALRAAYPDVPVLPVVADYMEDVPLPEVPGARRLVVYFPGSTIGNFDPVEAQHFLRRKRGLIGPDGAVLIGVDLQKNPAALERAYNDPEGLTGAFNLNLLDRINRELGGDFRTELFEHRARYDASLGRIEMHLVSLVDQVVHVGGRAFSFRAGESIHTENSYKHTVSGFARLAASAGLAVRRVWTDPAAYFSVQLLTPA